MASFQVGGVQWNTVNSQLGSQFAMNSGSALSRSSAQLQQWDQMKDQIIYAAQYSKFNQHPELERILLLT